MMQPSKKKIRSHHKVNIRKERLKQKKRALKKEDSKSKQKQKSAKDAAFDTRIERETKMYWIRGATGAISALILNIIGFVGWLLLIWLIILLVVAPFVINFILGYKFEKEVWTWKNVLRPGLGLCFFLFMFVSVIVHTTFVVLDIGIRITWNGIIF